MNDQRSERRRFLSSLLGVGAAFVAGMLPRGSALLHAAALGRVTGSHPTPRPGVNASKVLTRDRLGENPDAIAVFDMVRKIPQIVDGIRCQCGCSALEGKYSLLSCFEEDGMAQHCETCQGQARLVYSMHRQRKTLDQIRAAIDAKFG